MTGSRSAPLRRRPRWLTVPLHLLLGLLVAVDVWSAIFWARVGGSLGPPLAVGATVVALALVLLMLTDLRRQWLLSLGAEEGSIPPGVTAVRVRRRRAVRRVRARRRLPLSTATRSGHGRSR